MNNNRLICILSVIAILIFNGNLRAQVKITDGSGLTLDQNSILELESSGKGLLIPRVAINNSLLPAPLTAPVPQGMLVYSLGGTVKDGFYYWNGSNWVNITGAGSSSLKTYSKTTSSTLEKTNSIIFASNNITLTLPAVTSADTGLQITIKNTGNHTDLVTVIGNGSATIDNMSDVEIYPSIGRTFVARGNNWHLLNRESYTDEILDVGQDEPFKTIGEAIDFLKAHMEKSTVIRLSDEVFNISSPIIINLPFPLTIEGVSYGANTIAAASGLSGKPIFRCISECYFKMLMFDGTALAGYGTSSGEDAIRFAGSGTYHEIKDCTFDGFHNAILDSTDAELWLFECDISNCSANGLLIHGNVSGVKVRVSETDFIGCLNGVNLSKGSAAEIQLMSGVYTNNTGDNAIVYNSAAFSFNSMIITNNTWNHSGTGITGFDFTRTDGRDANAYIENNPGLLSNKPHCKINIVNNVSTTTCTNSNTWYKANWTNTSSLTTNIKINNNNFTYLPGTSRDLVIHISGNVMVNSSNRVITIAIVKNGNSTVRYGETTLRVTTSNQPFQFSTVIYIEDVQKNDYFEMFCSSTSGGDILTFQDIHLFVTTE
jgi:hypothetical protein